MPSLPEHPDRLDDDALPDALIAELGSAATRNTRVVPAAVDAEILRQAKAGFARRSRFRLAARVVIGVAAAAAAVVAIALPLMRQADHDAAAPHGTVATKMLNVMPAPAAAAAAEDVDHDGKVDILDAFVVAKLVETGKQIDAGYDVNGDGKVDQSDVDRIAHAAVAVVPADDRRVQ
jgi:hypothetical protein